MNYLVLIPARGGSKGVPFKNIKLLDGLPLICYILFEAAMVFKKSQILISTDDPQIKEVCENNGFKVPFIRPQELAKDNSGSYEVVIHALRFADLWALNKYDLVFCLGDRYGKAATVFTGIPYNISLRIFTKELF